MCKVSYSEYKYISYKNLKKVGKKESFKSISHITENILKETDYYSEEEIIDVFNILSNKKDTIDRQSLKKILFKLKLDCKIGNYEQLENIFEILGEEIDFETFKRLYLYLY
ncbi:hypothetical protein NUSPORA_02465 [Nucleospora cyclopteri]